MILMDYRYFFLEMLLRLGWFVLGYGVSICVYRKRERKRVETNKKQEGKC